MLVALVAKERGWTQPSAQPSSQGSLFSTSPLFLSPYPKISSYKPQLNTKFLINIIHQAVSPRQSETFAPVRLSSPSNHPVPIHTTQPNPCISLTHTIPRARPGSQAPGRIPLPSPTPSPSSSCTAAAPPHDICLTSDRDFLFLEFSTLLTSW